MLKKSIIAHLKMKYLFQIYEKVNPRINFLEFKKATQLKYEIYMCVCGTWDLTLVARTLNYIKWAEFIPNHCVVASSNDQ